MKKKKFPLISIVYRFKIVQFFTNFLNLQIVLWTPLDPRGMGHGRGFLNSQLLTAVPTLHFCKTPLHSKNFQNS